MLDDFLRQIALINLDNKPDADTYSSCNESTAFDLE